MNGLEIILHPLGEEMRDEKVLIEDFRAEKPHYVGCFNGG